LLLGIWLLVLGVLGAASLIISRRPDASEAIAKLTPYQGWIGAASAIWGIINIIRALVHINILSVIPIWWVTWMATAIVLTGLGILLGVGVFKSFIKDATANAKMDQTVAALAPYQTKLGLASIGLGVWAIVVSVVWL
jgi:hypothetical protein